MGQVTMGLPVFLTAGGKRTAERAQLCLTNQELRAFVLERLRGFKHLAMSFLMEPNWCREAKI